MTVAQSVRAGELADELERIGIHWVISVPDTHQRTLIAEVERREQLRLLTCCTEDEGVTIAAGLYLGGQDAVLMIQHAGLYACVNNLRGVALDAKIPIFMMIGLLGREPSLPPRESQRSMVRLAEPLLETLGIPYSLIDNPEQLDRLAPAFQSSRHRQGPVAVLIGHETI
ncbi:MAG: thiamine pyrophosphate-binding protein [Dehalococcoidia bacterium]